MLSSRVTEMCLCLRNILDGERILINGNLGVQAKLWINLVFMPKQGFQKLFLTLTTSKNYLILIGFTSSKHERFFIFPTLQSSTTFLCLSRNIVEHLNDQA